MYLPVDEECKEAIMLLYIVIRTSMMLYLHIKH
jgi:hypothetical protein